jgi:hypothetical protein
MLLRRAQISATVFHRLSLCRPVCRLTLVVTAFLLGCAGVPGDGQYAAQTTCWRIGFCVGGPTRQHEKAPPERGGAK